MSDGFSYIVEMVDKISGPAKTAQQQIQAMTGKLTDQVEALKKLEAEQKKLQDQGPVTASETKKFEAGLSKAKAAIDKTSGSIRSSVGAQQKQATAAGQAAAKQQLAAGATGELGGALEALGPIAAVAGAALIGLGAALGSALLAGAKLALEAREFKEDTLNALSSITGSSEKAEETFDIVRKLTANLPISEEKGFALAKRLLNAGVGQEQMAEALKAAANLQAVAGEEGVAKLEKLIEKSATGGKFTVNAKQLVGTGVQLGDLTAAIAKKTGKSIGEATALMKKGGVDAAVGIQALNDAINTKLGGAAQKKMLSLSVQAEKFQDNLRQMFEDVDTSGFLQALSQVGALFTSNTTTGAELKGMVTRIFTGLFAAAQQAIPYIIFAFKEMVIVALKIEIAMKPVVKKLKEMWGAGEQGDATKNLIKTVVDLLVYLVGGLIVGIGYWLIFASYAIKFWSAVIDIATSAGQAIGGAFSAVGQFFLGIFSAAPEVAQSMIDGLVNGITGGAQAVINAITGVAKGGIQAAKKLLGIASPSRVFADIGGNTAEGFAQGVDDGAARTQGSLESAISPPAAKGGAAASSSAAAAPSIQIAIEVHAGNANAQELAELLPARLTEALEEFWMQMGGGGTRAPA